MNNFLLINKKVGKSSYDVIRSLKKEFNHSKFGHSGTLDPLASGLLIIANGKQALKALRFVNNQDKEYIATLKLGIKTNTGDITGKVIKTKDIVKVNDWNLVIKSFLGEQFQKPPVYSAKKINGKKAYELARKGLDVKLKPQEINVKAIKLLNFDDRLLKFKVLVSKGTYIRTLCEDIALKSGNIGTMSSLIRTKIGNFSIERACDINNVTDKCVVSILDILDLKKIKINKMQYDKITQGQRFNLEQKGAFALIYKKRLVSVVSFNKKMKIIRNFNEDY